VLEVMAGTTGRIGEDMPCLVDPLHPCARPPTGMQVGVVALGQAAIRLADVVLVSVA
jgi:hypothetical protein